MDISWIAKEFALNVLRAVKVASAQTQMNVSSVMWVCFITLIQTNARKAAEMIMKVIGIWCV
jgi:hypothetical protein